MLGTFVLSCAGRDQDAVYVVIREDQRYVYLADGKYKTTDKPKRKNRRHIRLVQKKADAYLLEKLLNNQKIYNEEIRKAIESLA